MSRIPHYRERFFIIRYHAHIELMISDNDVDVILKFSS